MQFHLNGFKPGDPAVAEPPPDLISSDGLPEEVAHATLSLCLPSASYLNGVVLPVDGGMTIQNG